MRSDQVFTTEQAAKIAGPAASPEPGILAKLGSSISQAWNDMHIGQGHATGMLRLGGHELTQALAAFPDSNIRPVEEPGVFGNPTPQIVTQEMDPEMDMDI